eukprot:COSAG02_NODE_51417_length_314_cov_0.804651_1_plen_32_part_10
MYKIERSDNTRQAKGRHPSDFGQVPKRLWPSP